MQVTFLKSGTVTWTSKSGKTEKRCYIDAGTTLDLRVEKNDGGYELWDGNWSILVPTDTVCIEGETIWARVGDMGEYEPFFSVDEALEYLNDLNVGTVTGWIDGGPGVGIETANYHGLDFISLYVGDCHADLLRPLNSEERAAVEAGLQEAYI